MTSNIPDEVDLQRRYYAKTANQYDEMHVNSHGKDEHFFALSFMVGILDYLDIKSILDIGSGTGRSVEYIKHKRPDIRIVGIEPIEELREIGHRKGIGENELINGDATQLKFGAEEFDLVCEFGALHHIRSPERAVSEMLRTSRKAIFLSDSNNFGQGSLPSRSLKQLINFFGLWKVADFVKTRGKGYLISDGDGLAYSYSVFNNYKQIKRQCQSIHLLNTNDASPNLYKTAGHIALLGIKRTQTR